MRLPTCLSVLALLGCTSPEVHLDLLLTGDYILVAVDDQFLPAVINTQGSTLTIASEQLTAVRTSVTFTHQASLSGPNGTVDLSITCNLDVVGLEATRFQLVPTASNGCPFSADVVWTGDRLTYTRDGRVHQLLKLPCEPPIVRGSPPAVALLTHPCAEEPPPG
jgi:hypothetical protein